jgi:hypothetical protein
MNLIESSARDCEHQTNISVDDRVSAGLALGAMRSLRPSADKAGTHEFMRAAAVTPGKARDRPFIATVHLCRETHAILSRPSRPAYHRYGRKRYEP